MVLVNRRLGPYVTIATELSAGRQGRESGQRQNFFSEQFPDVAYRPSFYLVCAEHYPSVVRGLSMNWPLTVFSFRVSVPPQSDALQPAEEQICSVFAALNVATRGDATVWVTALQACNITENQEYFFGG